MQLATMHPIQIWMHPLGIRKISKANLLISALKTVRHPNGSSYCLCWAAEVGIAQYTRCFVQCYRAHYAIKVLLLWSWQRRLLPLCIRNIYTIYMHNRASRTCRKVSAHAHPQRKPLHPVFMGWLRAWQKAKQRMVGDFTVSLYRKIKV